MMRPALVIAILVLNACPVKAQVSTHRIPVIYGTDLFHPHDDPDDHFDLATLFALPEFDVKAILLDLGERQRQKPGRVPLEQMFQLTGRRAPFAPGLSKKLKSPDDTGRDQPAADQQAIELLIKTLRASAEPMTVITAGSVRDVCAAFNRDPQLLREKIARLYINIGSTGEKREWNVGLDLAAYIGLMRSGLPIYWCPCLPFNNKVSTHWVFHQQKILSDAPPALQNFFIYALQRVDPNEIDPQRALKINLQPWRRLVFDMQRNMWCTASFLHAAGRQSDPLFTFAPARVEVDEKGLAKVSFDADNPNVHVFRMPNHEKYTQAMTDCLHQLLHDFPVITAANQRK